MTLTTIADYFVHIRKKPIAHRVENAYTIRLVNHRKSKRIGTIHTKEGYPLVFTDGATLRFTETIEIIDSQVHPLRYSYHYQRGDYFFRYDKDPDHARYPDHAECHLHANNEEPRFMTHQTSFEEVFDFIIVCFYTTS